MTEKKAIQLLRSYAGMTHKLTDNQGRPKLDQAIEKALNLIQKQQAEIEKKDKIIDLMAEEIIKNLCYSTIDPNYELPYLDEKIRKTFENIKQYFEKQVKKDVK